MWPDPADTSRHRPRHMKGTPANKASVIFSLTASAVFIGIFFALSCTPWCEKRFEKYRQQGLKLANDRAAKELLQDPLVKQALQRKEAEYEGKGYKVY